MKFQPGVSGNPRGRPRKRAVTNEELRGELRTEIPAILKSLVQRALEGDTASAKLVLERAIPPLRPVSVAVPIALGELSEAPRRILAAVAAGDLTVDEANTLASAVASLARTIESQEFEARLAALEVANAQP